MMAALIRYANVNPYWNVPPSLNRTLVAPRMLKHGLMYLSERKYEVFADWSENAPLLDPATVDWQAVRTAGWRFASGVVRAPATPWATSSS